MAKLSIGQIYDAARDAGFTPEQAVTWTAIAMAESGGQTGALNDRGEYSVGLWQINVRADEGRRTRYGDLHDPAANARAAYDLSHHGRDMRPWTTTHDRNKGTAADYRTYLPRVERLIGVEGDDRGVGGYHSPLPPVRTAVGALQHGADDPAGAAWEMPRGRSLAGVSSPDSDHDGLTNHFEKLAGTGKRKVDTDGDGMSDGYEALSSHTDPLRADTDRDGSSDVAELARHEDAGTVPGVAGVVGTGLLAESFRHVEDADDDGLSDFVEERIGTDGRDADSDDDQVPDALEVSLGTNPLDADTDDDGATDHLEYRQGGNPLAAGSSTTNTVPIWTMDAAAAELAASRTVPEPVDGPGAGSGALSAFLTSARDQIEDPYVYGARLQPERADPTQFDCSSLTAWAAAQAGVKLPRTAEEQYRLLKSQGLLVPVDQAMETPGALLFYFSVEPSGQLAAGNAHVAISDGHGRTIEAKNSREGVGSWSAKGRFNYAAVIPGISDPKGLAQSSLAGPVAASSTALDDDLPADGAAWEMPEGRSVGSTLDRDADHDGLSNAFEKILRTRARSADSDRDGLSDAREATETHTDPTKADTDGDGQTDEAEVEAGTAAGTVPGMGGVVGTGRFADRYDAPDADRDGLSDRVETEAGLRADDADSDDDGLSDWLEVSLGTDGLLADTDGDGLTDKLEYQYGLDPLAPGSSLPARAGRARPGSGDRGRIRQRGRGRRAGRAGHRESGQPRPGLAVPMDPPIFAEKVRRPDARRIDRPRLERRLLADDAPPLALVLAPPGSGKTTLLSAAAAATRPSAWYRAEAEDHTEPAFVRHVAQSLCSAGVLPVASGLPLTVTALVEALESAEALPATLVVDDVHEIAATPAETALERFVLHRTRRLRLMLGSRRPPALNTPRLMVSGELLQLDGEDLRFRSWEVEELFRDLYDRPLSPSAAAALTRRTGGWAAGLRLFQLATSALNRAERERAVEELSGRSRLIRSYLARNVLAGLAEDQLAFLLHTCTLGELTGDLCDELLDSQGSAEVLEALEQAQFFTTSSDGGTTFQYHQVLQTHLEVLLVDRLGPQVARARYARSAELLEQSGRVGAAIRAYGRAEDWVAVGRMLRQTSSALVPDDVPRWGPLDPAGPTVDDPSLGVAAARRLLRSGQVREAVVAYQHAESLLDDPEFRNRCADERAVAAVWLPDADDLSAAQRQTGPRALRLARQLRHTTRSLRDLDEPALDLAAGLRLLLAGRPEDAQRAFDRALDDPEATPVERQVARLAARLAALRRSSEPAARPARRTGAARPGRTALAGPAQPRHRGGGAAGAATFRGTPDRLRRSAGRLRRGRRLDALPAPPGGRGVVLPDRPAGPRRSAVAAGRPDRPGTGRTRAAGVGGGLGGVRHGLLGRGGLGARRRPRRRPPGPRAWCRRRGDHRDLGTRSCTQQADLVG